MSMIVIPPAALSLHTAVLGMTGAGKTNSEKVAIEQVYAESARVCILDPIKSDWWGITSSADGRKAGLPFHILGGPRGHVPLHSGAGAAVAELVAHGKLRHSIIDMAAFEPGGQVRFFIDFMPVLLREMRGFLYLVLEEAHIFAPKERGGVGNETMSTHWAKMVATAGRSRGIRLIVATQRTQSLHNAVLGSCQTLIAHRLTAPADQKPVLDWLKAHIRDAGTRSKVGDTLGSMKTGEGWIVSGEAGIAEVMRFPKASTYDNTRTPTDDDTTHDVTMAAVDRHALRAIIGEAVQEAEANDPKALKEKLAKAEDRIAELEGGAPAAAGASASAEEIAAAEGRGFESGKAEGLRLSALGFEGLRGAVREARASVVGALEELEHGLDTWQVQHGAAVRADGAGGQVYVPNDEDHARPPSRTAPPPAAEYSRQAVQERHTPAGSAGATAPRATPGNTGLAKGERAVLTVCAQYPDEGATREQISILTGYKQTARDTYISRLRQLGYIDGDRGAALRATKAGIKALGNFVPLPTGKRLQQYWLERLSGGERAILSVLVQNYPREISRERIGEITQYKQTARDTYLSRLNTKRLITMPRRGFVAASRILFD